MTTETQADSSAEGTVATPRTTINFLGLDGLPIANLDVLIKVDGQEYKKSTDADGNLPLLQAEADTAIEILVKRMDGSYKPIDSCTTSSADACWTYTSPALVLEAKTQLHAGEPGDIEVQIPRYKPEDAGVIKSAPPAEPAVEEPPVSNSYREEGLNHPKPTTSTVIAAASNKPATNKLPDPSRAEAPKTGASAPLTTGRNSKGEPVAVYTEKSRDWWGRWLMSTLHFLGLDTSVSEAHAEPKADAKAKDKKNDKDKPKNSDKAKAEGASAKTKDSPKAAPAASASSAIATSDTSVAYSGSMTDQVKKLIEIATEQTGYLIACGTSTFLANQKSKKLQEYPTKDHDKAEGYCYVYVKVALVRANIISTAPSNVPASEAGPELTHVTRGFLDVTESVPDPRWAAAGDVIVYAWTPKVLEEERQKDAYATKVKEYKAQGKKIDFKQSDMSAADSNKANMGHIDIRSYDGYMSDHIPKRVIKGQPDQPGEPKWSRYNPNPRIYRKVYDPMPTLRMVAFLRCIRDLEVTEEPVDEKRYSLLNTALPSNPGSRRFDSFKAHPWDGQANPNKVSDAAGAYQIRYETWKEKFDKGLIVVGPGEDKFSPAIQHRIAVMKLYDRGALNHIRMGEIETAITNTTLPKEWSSLPGGGENLKRKNPEGGPLNLPYFMGLFNRYLEEEKRKANLK